MALLVAIACSDQPTEPTPTEAPFQALLGPPPADVTPLNGTLPAGNGGPVSISLGYWESPALAKITVNGLLTWNNPGNEDGYFPRPSGQLNYLGRYIPSLNLCASQLSVRVIGYGAVGGAEGGCPGYWQTVSSVTNYNIVSGQVVLARAAPALGACYYGGSGCATLTGVQDATVEPIDGQLTIKLDTTIVRPGQLVNARFGTDPVAVEGFNLPFTLREVRFEGQGPILGGGTPKGCVAFYSPTFCGIQFFQSGYVVAEGMVSGKLRIQKQWVRVLGGDSLPPPPPPDSIPPDSIPPDSLPGGGGGGGGGCAPSIARTGVLAACEPPGPPPTISVLSDIEGGFLPNALPGGLLPEWGIPVVLGASLADSTVLLVQVDSAGSPVKDRSVSVTLFAVDSGGDGSDATYGHFHQTAAVKPAGSFTAPRGLATDSVGRVRIVFHSSIISGPVRVHVEVSSAIATDYTVPVGVPGLQSLVERSSDKLIGNTASHPDNHFVTPTMGAKLDSLADTLYALYSIKSQYNDASLAFGGKFDLNRAWNGDHVEHRLGRDIDFRTIEAGTKVWTDAQLKQVTLSWQRLGGSVHDETDTDTPHYHLRYRGNE